MKSRWSNREADRFLQAYSKAWGEDLALRTYSSRLLGQETALVLHGGGNTSVKATHRNILGEDLDGLFVKASGHDLANIEPEGHSGLDLEPLRRLRSLPRLSDDEMGNQCRIHLLNSASATPSIETLVHAFLPMKFIDHTHADAILALTNQPEGEDLIREALDDDVGILPYVEPGFQLAQASATTFESGPDTKGMVWLRHGLVTWGEEPQVSYERTIELVSKAEAYLKKRASKSLTVLTSTSPQTAKRRWVRIAPLLRGLLAQPSGDADRPYRRVILTPLIDRETLTFLGSKQAKDIALSPPLTSDHLIRTKALPLWIDSLPREESEIKVVFSASLDRYRCDYEAYLKRNARRLPSGVKRFDATPRVVLIPGVGALCAGEDIVAAGIARDITRQTLKVKAQVASMGKYEGLSESDLFGMEYRSLQHDKLDSSDELPLRRQVGLVTGAAGAIGSGISHQLLAQGCHVVLTDLPGEPLQALESDLRSEFGERVLAVPLDVTDRDSVGSAFDAATAVWGGIDLVIVNAGIALVSSLEEMEAEAFRRVQRVNVEGTLNSLSAAARHFRIQGTGGDVVLISTKNVFSPGASFGAYSATKAAAHQLARIASLEMAEIGVRVNMVAPDAVFSEGTRESGLWATVGPDRMRARGLDQKGLEEYYRNRNLLRARITATHVARAVLFLATHQTPTTGATIPVDGGLPDATPR